MASGLYALSRPSFPASHITTMASANTLLNLPCPMCHLTHFAMHISHEDDDNLLSFRWERRWSSRCFHCYWWVHTLTMITRYAWPSHIQLIECLQMYPTIINYIYALSKSLNRKLEQMDSSVSFRFLWQTPSDMVLWWFLCCYPEQTIEQIFELLLIGDFMMPV